MGKSKSSAQKTAPQPLVAYPGFKELGEITRTTHYQDPFVVSPFTAQKVTVALLSIVWGFSSGVYTIPVAQSIVQKLGLTPSQTSDIVLGTLAFSGNAALNTQQIYDSLFHLHKLFTKIFQECCCHPSGEVKKSSKYKTVGSFICALSGAVMIGYIAWQELQGNYARFRWFTVTAAASSFAEFFLGGDSLVYVFTKQIPALFSCSERVKRFPISQEQEDRQLELESIPRDFVSYGSFAESSSSQSSADSIKLINQHLSTVFTKLSVIFHGLTQQEKNTLGHFYRELYRLAGADFSSNPGLIFSLILLGKIDVNHPLFENASAANRQTIVGLLNNKDIKALLSKLRDEINQIDWFPMNGKNRARLFFSMGLIAFTCFSYLWDVGIYFSDLFDSPWGGLLGLIGSGGAAMMFTLGVSLFNTYIANDAQKKFAKLALPKIIAGILLGLAAALLEASLCASMVNIPAISWVFSILGGMTKGLIINSPYTYKLIDAAAFTAGSLVKYLKSCCCSPAEEVQESAEEIIDKLAQYADILEHNATQLPYTDLNDLAQGTQAPGDGGYNPKDEYLVTPKQSWGSWFYSCVRKPYEKMGLCCPRPEAHNPALVMDV
jgi:hypothetical protein